MRSRLGYRQYRAWRKIRFRHSTSLPHSLPSIVRSPYWQSKNAHPAATINCRNAHGHDIIVFVPKKQNYLTVFLLEKVAHSKL